MEKDKKNTPVEDCKICARAELSDDEMEQVSGGVEPAVSGGDNLGPNGFESKTQFS